MKVLKEKQASLSATSKESSGASSGSSTGTCPHSSDAQSKLLKNEVAEHEDKKARKAGSKREENSAIV